MVDFKSDSVQGARGMLCQLEENLFSFGIIKAEDYDGVIVGPHYGGNMNVGSILRLGTEGSLKYVA